MIIRMQKKYQIFVSSTFRDLLEERQAVLEAILELNHIPCGMEAFPANNSTPFELIQRMIDDSDYYILIIGGRYGSLSENGISYTEMEYDYASEKKKQILCFIHSSPADLAIKNVDTKNALSKKLEKFKQKASKHIVKHWSNKFDLKSYVLSSLSIAFQLNPMPGWIKLKEEYDQSFLVKLNELQSKYNELQDKYIQLKEKSLIDTGIDVEKYNQKIKLEFFISSNDNFGNDRAINPKRDKLHEIEFTYLELLFGLSDTILSLNSEYIIAAKISSLIFNMLQGTPQYEALLKKENADKIADNFFTITLKTYKRIKIQFVSFGWIELDYINRLHADYNNHRYESISEAWRLSTLGKRLISENIDSLNIS